MKKMFNIVVETIKKHDNICVFIYMILALSVYVYAVPLSSYDELWNFSFVYKMTNGYTIYKDLNVITTPMFHYLGEIIMKIFGNNYISFRIYNILILSSLITIIYNFLKKLKIKKINAYIYILIILVWALIKKVAVIGASYNFLCLVFVILGICLELNENNKKINKIYKGLIMFCIFMTKQNVWFLYIIALTVSYLIKIKRKEIQIKEIIKNLILVGISFSIPLIIFILYLYINDSLNDFISYCFMGVREFGSKNKIFYINSIPYILASLIGIIISVILIRIKNVNEKIKQINLKTIPFQVIMLLWAYPIIDSYHTGCGSLISILIIFYNLHNIFIIEFINKTKFYKIEKMIICIVSIFLVLYNIWYLDCYINSKNISKFMIEPYKNIYISTESQKKITNICNYIKENNKNNIEVKLISCDANIYMNILNKNNKNLDLPFLGNLGENGEERLINEIKNLKKGTKILLNNKLKCYQESDKVKKFIVENYNKIGEIEDFDIYEK